MSFKEKSKHDLSVAIASETGIALAATGTEYSSQLPDGVSPNMDKEKRYIIIAVNASAVSGTNLDIGLYGVMEEGGDKVLLADLGDVAATGLNKYQVDLNANPALSYFVGWTVDSDESSNTIDVYVAY